MTLNWQDTTSFSRDDLVWTPEQTFTAHAGRFRLVVTKQHIINPGRWTLHIYPGLADTVDLMPGTDSPGAAQDVAEDKLRAILATAAKALESDNWRAPAFREGQAR